MQFLVEAGLPSHHRRAGENPREASTGSTRIFNRSPGKSAGDVIVEQIVEVCNEKESGGEQRDAREIDALLMPGNE